tara:strand:- start:109 stop:642 length:534 start_codon:yes stop_codon:yes gene_type:complete
MINQIEINNYWEIIKYNYDQIRYAEFKASIVISIYSLFFSIAYTIDIIDDENSYALDFNNIYHVISLLFLVPAFYFTIKAMVYCVKCFLPRLNIATKKSPLFFGDIGTGYKDFDEYLSELDKLMDDQNEYHKHLSQMIYVTGHIAFTKFSNVNKGVKSLLKSLFLYIIFIILVFAIN